FAGDDGQRAVARQLDGLERAAEGVVVGNRDRTEPLLLCLVNQLLGVDETVVRPRGVHVEVADDPGPVGERILPACPRTAPAGEASVDLVEPAPQLREALRPCKPARL